jgi:lipopolysaccharide transport system ATP-binding protein
MTQPIVQLSGVCLRYKSRRALFRRDYFTALSDVSFEVRQGETLGLVGTNGAGKSTLLKIIAKIYGAERGEVTWHCEHVSLLSLALGFDPLLTGRDNAIISGMLLGARKHQIMAMLDEIIEFSELDDFIDKQVKTYSTGMRARLAFAVAIKMSADLLLVDEVLSVGDPAFRQKAAEAMVHKIKSEQTVVLVSHSRQQVLDLCDRALWLHQGRVQMIGNPGDVLNAYQQSLHLDTEDS